MCFKKKDGSKTLLSRWYKYKTGLYTLYLKNKKEDKILDIELTNNGGNISFVLLNTVNEEKRQLENPITGNYQFELTKDTKYRLSIKAKGAIGSYKVRLIPKKI